MKILWGFYISLDVTVNGWIIDGYDCFFLFPFNFVFVVYANKRSKSNIPITSGLDYPSNVRKCDPDCLF